MHSAFQLVPVGEAVSAKIECLAQWQSNLYIGTGDGNVILYRVERGRSPAGELVYNGHLESKKNLGYGRKPVRKIEAIGELGALVVLCDGNLSLHDLGTLESTFHISIDSAQTFVTSKHEATYRLCVATKRRLLLFHHMHAGFSQVRSLDIPDAVICLSWFMQHFMLGFKRDFSMMDSESGSISELFQLERNARPCLCDTEENEVALCTDTTANFVNYSAEPTRSSIAFDGTVSPLFVSYSRPYLLVCMAKTIDVFNIFDQKKLQTINFNNAAATASDGSRVFVANVGRVFCLEPIPFQEQVQELVQSKRVEEALQLFNLSTTIKGKPREEAERSIYRHAGFVMFHDLQFKQAKEYFLKAELSANEVLQYVPDVLPKGSRIKAAEKTLKDIVEEGVSSRSWIDDPTASKEKFMMEGRFYIAAFLKTMRQRLVSQNREGELEVADTSLCLLIAQMHASKLREKEAKKPQELTNIELFLDRKNSVSVRDVAPALERHGLFNALALLYKSRGDTVKALEMWKRLGEGKVQEPHRDGIAPTIELLQSMDDSDLLWSFSPWVLARDAQAALAIFTSTVRERPLSPDKVLDFLSARSPLLFQQYLEHVVYELDHPDEKYHTRLALSYISNILAALPQGVAPSSPEARMAFLSAPEGSEIQTKRALLARFLEERNFYDSFTLLTQIRATALYEEAVILYRKARKHEEALRTIVRKIGDLGLAETYCLAQADAGVTTETLLLTFLRTMLDTEGGTVAPLHDAVIVLLESHADKFDPEMVLETLPPTTSVASTAAFLQKVIRSRVTKRRGAEIEKNLAKIESLTVRMDALRIQTRSAVVTKDTVCAVCGNKIDNVFVCYPNYVMVHFKCHKQRHICPVTGRNFEQENPTLRGAPSTKA